MATEAELYVPSSIPSLPLSDALLFQLITVSEVRFLLPMNDMYGFVFGINTFSLQIILEEKKNQ